ncbi:hypothetical protein GNI_177510 [Gregarina niphandrodes]|uniref:TAF6 C-terminal HEAT repeat domain-containing protein n=1 Tax=Gregarina niphandrodes TaxID=110365 RepID=A0A023AX68_GRENI|nr:hypothetical protein GNI_177510 [Gregarina niphandrodes]EZG43304.1 hypothetical protein GNI_177510 [Gregarina niphandrodes]|eukprot:XP_011133446.1 hypothetical protein GNI_177510 [Gregarina niphandrodes]
MGYRNSEVDEEAWDVMCTAIEYKMRTLIEHGVRVAHRSNGMANLVLDANAVITATRLLRWDSVPTIGCRGFWFESDVADGPVMLDDFLAEESSIPVPSLPCMELEWVTMNGRPCSSSAIVLDSKAVYKGRPGDTTWNEDSWFYQPNWSFRSFEGFHREFVKRPISQGPGQGSDESASLFMKVLMEKCDSNSNSTLQSVLVIPKNLDRYLSDEYRLYLQRLLSCIIGALKNCAKTDLDPVVKAQDKLALGKIMQSLGEGPAPSKLVPFVFALICGLVPPAVAEGPPEAVLITLHVLVSYVQNPRVKSKPYLHQIIQAFLLALLAPTMGPMDPPMLLESLEVRKLASEGLSFVVRGAGTPTAFISVVEILSATLRKEELPLTTLIGAVMGCSALGEEAVKVAVKPLARNLTQALSGSNTMFGIHGGDQTDTAFMKAKAELTNVLLELVTRSINQQLS